MKKKSDISNSVAIPVELNTKPIEAPEASEELANSIRQKYAPLNTTIENADLLSPSVPSSVVISEEELTGDLPSEYGETRIVIQVRDPHWAWVYWEFSSQEKKKLKEGLGAFEFAHTEMLLRVFNESMNYMFEVKLPENCDNWYLSLNDSNCDYCVQLCAHAPSLGTLVLATSKTVHTPTDKVSGNVAKWVAARPAKPIEVVESNTEIPPETTTFIEAVSVEGAYIGSSEEFYKREEEDPAASSDFSIKIAK